MSLILIWAANGFDPRDPFEVDNWSRVSLAMMVEHYKEQKDLGNKVYIGVFRSMAHDPSGQHVFWETCQRVLAEATGLEAWEIFVFDDQSWGSPTDGMALAKYIIESSDRVIKIFCAREVAKYCEATYRAVARIILGVESLPVSFHVPNDTRNTPRASLKTRAMYGFLT